MLPIFSIETTFVILERVTNDIYWPWRDLPHFVHQAGLGIVELQLALIEVFSVLEFSQISILLHYVKGSKHTFFVCVIL